MRTAWACIAMFLGAACASQAAAPADAVVLHIDTSDMQALKAGLLALTQERLRPLGLVAEERRAWMNLSNPLPATDWLEVRPLWSADADAPQSPFAFELRPTLREEPRSSAAHDSRVRSVQATLTAPVLREVWVATRRLRKGSSATCADLRAELREVRYAPKTPLSAPCEIDSEAVALREIGAGDVMRADDIGRAPDVGLGQQVRVRAASNGVIVTIVARALADAKVGDQVDVRLQHPMRTFRTRVIAPGSVELVE